MEKEFSDRQVEKFLKEFIQLEPIEVFGIATILNIPIYKPGQKDKDRVDKEYRPSEEIMANIIEEYFNRPRNQRRRIDIIIKKANKK